jgi:hypothetical protein
MYSVRTAVFVLAVMCLAACGGVGSPGSQTPGERLVAAMELIREGKPKELEAFVVRDDQVGVGMFAGVYSSGWAGEGGLDRVEIVSEKIDGESATVAVKFHFANGTSETMTYSLKQEDGAWRLVLP